MMTLPTSYYVPCDFPNGWLQNNDFAYSKFNLQNDANFINYSLVPFFIKESNNYIYIVFHEYVN